MTERAWIIATKRRDGTPPSIVKGAGDEKDAIFLYPVKEDAERHLQDFDPLHGWAIFPVDITVKMPGDSQ